MAGTLENAKKIFRHFDADGDGRLGRNEMAALIMAASPQVDLSREQTRAIIDEIFLTCEDIPRGDDRRLTLDDAPVPPHAAASAADLSGVGVGRRDPPSSLDSSVASSPLCSGRHDSELDHGDRPPQSEIEEIPSCRWLPGYEEMIHDLHPNHKLKLERDGSPYTCDGCKELGFHWRYACEESSCGFHLHHGCADPRPSLSHPFFKHCSFLFLTPAGQPRGVCDACGMDVRGSAYHCHKCDKDLHPCCANLDRFIEVGALKLELRKEMPSKCYRCGTKKVEGVSTWGYVSTDKTYSVHITCVKKLILGCWMTQKNTAGGGARGGSTEGLADGRALVKWTPMLQLVDGENKGSAPGKFAKIKRTVRLSIAVVVAAILGDPTSLIAGLVENLISN